MGDYYTKDEIALAKSVDLVDLLKRQGEVLTKSGSEYQWGEGSNKVTVRGNLWFHQYEQVGGNSLDFVVKFYDMKLTDAIRFLIGGSTNSICYESVVHKKDKKVKIPVANKSMRRIFAYLLNSRGLDRDIVYAFVHRRLIYESATHHNVVFVGYDNNKGIKHIHMRGSSINSNFKSNVSGSDLRYSFHWNGISDTLYLFESPIDMLSYITLKNDCNWKENTYVAACSVSDRALLQSLKDNPQIRTIVLCFDNDEAGKLATNKIKDNLVIHGYEVKVLTPTLKDWNEDLLFYRKEVESI